MVVVAAAAALQQYMYIVYTIELLCVWTTKVFENWPLLNRNMGELNITPGATFKRGVSLYYLHSIV